MSPLDNVLGWILSPRTYLAFCRDADGRPLLRRYLPRKDVFEALDDAELLRRYRLDRAGILFVTDLVRRTLESPTMRNNPYSAELKVLITLRYLATVKMQQCSSDDFGPSQPTISRVITQTLDALCSKEIITRFIRFPTAGPEIQQRKAAFMAIAGMPGIVGAIDGTHIRIVAPRDYEEEYVNRKNYHSINTQLVFDAGYKILDVVADWPGSVHDARILQHSGLQQLFQSDEMPAGSHLIGGSGYPSKPWLLTPYRQPLTDDQRAYNR
ncbi:putative nuclease HARBI1 [Eriocheir sinensis]|uniref:putative nuclease HARBI1 n=1 Tax=Eriocheir sinensis TaxID=95602 RepID=UPI0021C8C398|nr:putative nuclease HARBI1 [Eriocheir sinensis]